MRQAFHIFKKDVRHLRMEVSMALAAAAGFTSSVAHGAGYLADNATGDVGPAMLTYLVPAAWWVLIARLIYGEPLVGDQPFWITRPYSRKSLVAAKALFVFVFVNLPKLVGDVVILRAYGFRIWPELGGLLWTQALLMGLFVLPIVAICAITTGFVQFIITTFALGLAVAGWSFVIPRFGAGESWFALEWPRSYVIGLIVAVAALVIIAWQYARLDTARSRLIGGGTVVLALLVFAFLPWPAAFALQSRLSGQSIDVSAIRAGFDPDMGWRVRVLVQRDGTADVQVPLRITGKPALLERAEGITATIESPNGDVWRADRLPRSHVRSTRASTAFAAVLGSSFYEKVKNDPVRIRGSLYLTLYGNPRTAVLPIKEQPVFLPTPGVGLCSAVRTGGRIVLVCRSAFRSRPDLVTFHVTGLEFVLGAPPAVFYTLSYPQSGSYSPFPADANLYPVGQSLQTAEIRRDAYRDRAREIRAVALEPVAHIRRDFEITGLRLADYEVGR